MDAVRKKRSQDGAGPSRRQELEETLAALRDQEAVVKRTIELLQAGAVGTKPQAGDGIAAAAVGGQPRPTAEPRDYEQRLRQVTEEQKRRAKAFWGDVRKLLTNLRANKQVLAVFGLPVRSTPWGGVPANWDLYCQSVSEPMDLGTVRAMLGEDESKRQYQSPEEVKNHIQLIVANARAFNKNPSDPVLPVAGSLEQMFAKKWQDGQFETRWRLETARRQVENEELADLKQAAHGTVADKIRYFDNCVRRRLAEMQTAEPVSEAPFTWEQKRKLSVACSQLDDAQCSALVDVLVRHSDKGAAGEGGIVLDIGSLPNAALHELRKLVDAAAKSGPSTSAAPAARASAPAATVAPNAPSAAAPASAVEPAAATPAAAAPATDAAAPAAGADQAVKSEGAGAADPAARGAAEAAPAAAGAQRPLENGRAEAGADAATATGATATEAKSGGGGDSDSSSSSSSSSNNSSSSSSDDGGGGAVNGGSHRESPRGESTGDVRMKGSASEDSKQGESNHGKGPAELASEAAENRQSGDGGETVLMSRNVPLDDKPAPAILKAGSARDIEVHNAEDWDVPDTEPAAVAPAATAADTGAAAQPESAAAGGEKDALWEETRRQDALLQERKKAEADRLAREEEELVRQKRVRDDAAAAEAEAERAAEDAKRKAAEAERLARAEERKRALENEIRDPGEGDEEFEVGA